MDIMKIFNEYNPIFFLNRLRMSITYSEAGKNVSTFSGFACFSAYAGGHRAGPPQARSRQAGTVAPKKSKRFASRRESAVKRALGFLVRSSHFSRTNKA